ncbi:MAG: phenylalanine--tRNA ligase subunit alpha, partial [Chitinophagia bacterium]|nr:phenylalanine--tRNA ligase subunit alpha [Chitinophagia bacterium]
MHELHSQIAAYTQEIDSFKPATDADIENYRLRFLGSNGIVKALMGELKDVAPENRKAYGQLVNDLKNKAQDQYNHHKQALESSKAPAAKADFSMPGSALPIGTLHPLRVIESQIITLFERIGFSLAEGPEIVDDQVN